VLTVIVPTLVRGGDPPRTFASLARQRIDPATVEVIVVADGVEPSSAAAVATPDLPFPVRVVPQPRSGQAAARNRGAAEASGDVFAFIDDDMELSDDFLVRLVHGLDAGADVVIASVRIGAWVPDTLPVRRARRLAEEAAAGSSTADQTVGFEDVIFAAAAIRREWFERLGGFDPAFTRDGGYGNEDIEFGYRLLRAGATVRAEDAAVAYTDEAWVLGAALDRARRIGRSDVRLARRHPELAEVVFGHKLDRSRIERVVGTAVLWAPLLAKVGRPLRWVVHRFAADGGPIWTRAWIAVRALEYWWGVSEAGGRAAAFRGLAAAKAATRR
jgi:glycosyltransferase involved in cell wall biosynthesis